MPVAVLGDSDSHSYGDRILLNRPGQRGGRFRSTTLQWTEVLDRLRHGEVDLGDWGVHGTADRVARVMDLLRLPSRAPRKVDFRFNFAVSGAECDDLVNGPWRQAQRLLDVLRRDSDRWANGVVVIRIGVNDFGQAEQLGRIVRGDEDGAVRAAMDHCLDIVRGVVASIRAVEPRIAIVLVGIFDDSNNPQNALLWQTRKMLDRIAAALDVFDGGLRQIAGNDPRTAFFDDRAAFRHRWGGRDDAGRPAYRPVDIGGKRSIRHAVGDHPINATLADGHAGTASNALWAADLVELMRTRWAMPLTPIKDREIVGLVDPEGKFGIAGK